MVPESYYVALSAVLFTIGVLGRPRSGATRS